MIHRRIALLLLSSLAALALLHAPGLPAARALEPEGDLSAPHEGYLVKLIPEADAPASVFSGLEEEDQNPSPWFVLDSLEDALAIPEELVACIEPNYLVELLDLPENEGGPGAEPGEEPPNGFNDPLYREYQWNLQSIHVYDAWKMGLTGEGVKAGFVDSGVNRNHEDLDPERTGGANLLEDGLPDGQDTYGHGTFAAGITAAQSNNGLGLAGVAPGVQLMAYRVFDGRTTTTDRIARAIDQAIEDGCQILNLSLGISTFSNRMWEAVDRAQKAGILVIAAVGNSGGTALMYPAAYEGVIGVGSVDPGLTVSSFSQRNESVDFTAPAGGVAGLSNADDNKSYKTALSSSSNRGTSYAAPVITGLAALALGYDPEITPEQLFTLLQLSSTDLGEPGYDTSFGFGLPDAGRMAELLGASWTAALHPGREGVLALGTSDVYTYEVYPSLQLPVPIRPGFRFTGWYEDEDCLGDSLTELPAGRTGDRQLYAGWVEDPQAARFCWQAGYDRQGRLISLEPLAPELWEEALPLPGEDTAVWKRFWLDADFRPVPAKP